MSSTPTRCPLCGGAEHDRYRACDNPECELPVKHWPRVEALKARLDEVEWCVSNGIAFAFNMRPDDRDSPPCNTLDEELERTYKSMKRLVAIRDAAVELANRCEVESPSTIQEMWAAEERLIELVRQEAEHALPTSDGPDGSG